MQVDQAVPRVDVMEVVAVDIGMEVAALVVEVVATVVVVADFAAATEVAEVAIQDTIMAIKDTTEVAAAAIKTEKLCHL